jgi:glycosyltransferase involved in cell wall biosynthesis
MQVIALIEAPDHVSARYRVQAFAPALTRAGCSLRLEAIPRGAVERLRRLSGLRRYDAVVLQRQLLTVPELRFLRRMARRLIYDFDDAMLYRDSYHRRGHQSRQRERRFGAAVGSADTIIAGNSFLRSCAISSGARAEKIRVIPTCVDPQKYAPSPASSRAEGMELVWIGSSSTLAGLRMQRPMLARAGREIPGVRLRIICDSFESFDPLPVVPTPWDAATETAMLAAADVGISWVPDDVWSRGKCGLKLLQYGAAGLPSIANPVGVHGEIIRDGLTGILVNSEEQWIAAIRQLAADPQLRRMMGRNARDVIEQSYSVAAHSEAFVSAVIG